MKKLIIFVDGSNYYHSLKRAFNRTDIDFEKLSNFLSIDYDLIKIKFYSAPLNKQENLEKYKSQQKYFAKLKKIDKLELILGRLEKRNHHQLQNITSDFKTLFENLTNCYNLDEYQINNYSKLIESLNDYLKFGTKAEKGVDVNLAVDLVTNAYEDNFDDAIIISNDADFIPAIKIVQSKGKLVKNVAFNNCKAYHLKNKCDYTIFIKEISEFLLVE